MPHNQVDYKGDGSQISGSTPLYNVQTNFDSPEGYIADLGLRNAVNVALMLGQPLLLTGEPGTGKSLLAYSLARELKADVPDERGRLGPLIFHCKTTSTATDLFYRYDALRRFHDANQRIDKFPAIDTYINYEAIGLAILLAKEPSEVRSYLPEHLKTIGRKRCVVLIDEIDKAPRDLPNDILNEVEKMAFTVQETGKAFIADEEYRPILILTSNSERDLPSAFLRRCIFYNVPFPENTLLKKILSKRLQMDENAVSAYYDAVIELFEEIRTLSLSKKPATAELINWVRLLQIRGVTEVQIKERDSSFLSPTLGVLGKTDDDQQKINSLLTPATQANTNIK